jgi:hypothetical protein
MVCEDSVVGSGNTIEMGSACASAGARPQYWSLAADLRVNGAGWSFGKGG